MNIDLDVGMQGAGVFDVLPLETATAFYFAWVDPNETNFNQSHLRIDEDVFEFQIDQAEGDFAGMSLGVRNPRVGLLSAGRKRWAWLAWNDNGTAVPLFFGRLIGVPDDIQDESITMQFTARPSDFTSRKATLADTLRVAPYWDPIWLSDDNRWEDDTVLESRSQLWDVDRITHVLSATDILVGEESLLEFPNNDLVRDTLKIKMVAAPARAVQMVGLIPWEQAAAGSIDISQYIHDSWPNEDPNQQHLLTSFSGDGLESSWPKAESGIGGGWTVIDGSVTSKANVVIVNDLNALQVVNGVLTPIGAPPGSFVKPTLQAASTGSLFLESIVVPLWWMRAVLVVGYDVRRGYGDRVGFVLRTDVQDLVTLPDDDEVIKLEVNAINLTEGYLLQDGITIGDPIMTDARDRSFLPTERGLQALEYLIMVARATLIEHSRSVNVSFQVPFEYAPELNNRRSGRIANVPHPRLPGGTATGKIASYSIKFNGDDGQPICDVELACCVGYGNAITTSVGTADYIEDGYIDTTYFRRVGMTVAVGAGDIGYEPPADTPNDDGINFKQPLRAQDIVLSLQIDGSPADQRAVMDAVVAEPFTLLDTGRISEALQTVPTRVRMEFLPLTNGPFETPYIVTVTDLVLPQGINLEAAS